MTGKLVIILLYFIHVILQIFPKNIYNVTFLLYI